jgi:hypothetical protein
MTSDGYRAVIRSLGLTPCRPSFEGRTLHQTRTGDFQHVPDPELLSPEEREATIALIKFRLGIVDTH